MASVLNFNGNVTPRPGVYSKVNVLDPATDPSGVLAIVGGFRGLESATPTVLSKAEWLAAKPIGRASAEDIAERAYTPFGVVRDAAPNQVMGVNAGTSSRASHDFGGVRIKARVFGPEGNRVNGTLAAGVMTSTFDGNEEVISPSYQDPVAAIHSNGVVDAILGTGANTNTSTIAVTADKIEITLKSTAAADAWEDLDFTSLSAGGVPAAGVVTLNADDGSTFTDIVVTVTGLDATGSVATEAIDCTGESSKSSTTSWSFIHSITAANDAAEAFDYASFPSISTALSDISDINQWLTEADNALSGDLTLVLATGKQVAGSDLDAFTPLTLSVSRELNDKAQRLVDMINGSSAHLVAERLAARTIFTDAVAPLRGGTFVAPTAATYQAAFDALLDTNVDVIALMTSDLTVQQAALAHTKTAAERGKPRQVWTYVENDTTLTNAKVRARALNDEAMNLVMQGDGIAMGADKMALRLAAAQAGLPVGEPLTRKQLPVSITTQDSSLDPNDPAEAIQAGIVVVNARDGNFKVERGVTTYTKDNSPAKTEISVVHIINTVRRDLVTELETRIGGRVRSDSAGSIESLVKTRLALAMKNGLITTFNDLLVTISGDTATVSLGISPVLPLNFVTLTINVS